MRMRVIRLLAMMYFVSTGDETITRPRPSGFLPSFPSFLNMFSFRNVIFFPTTFFGSPPVQKLQIAHPRHVVHQALYLTAA